MDGAVGCCGERDFVGNEKDDWDSRVGTLDVPGVSTGVSASLLSSFIDGSYLSVLILATRGEMVRLTRLTGREYVS